MTLQLFRHCSLFAEPKATASVVPGGKNCLRVPSGEPGVPQQCTRYTEAEELLCTRHSHSRRPPDTVVAQRPMHSQTLPSVWAKGTDTTAVAMPQVGGLGPCSHPRPPDLQLCSEVAAAPHLLPGPQSAMTTNAILKI